MDSINEKNLDAKIIKATCKVSTKNMVVGVGVSNGSTTTKVKSFKTGAIVGAGVRVGRTATKVKSPKTEEVVGASARVGRTATKLFKTYVPKDRLQLTIFSTQNLLFEATGNFFSSNTLMWVLILFCTIYILSRIDQKVYS